MRWHYQTVDPLKREPQIGRGLFAVRLLILHFKFQFSKSIISLLVFNFTSIPEDSKRYSISMSAHRDGMLELLWAWHLLAWPDVTHVCTLSFVVYPRPRASAWNRSSLVFCIVVSTVPSKRIKRLKLRRGVDVNYFPTGIVPHIIQKI